MSPFGATTRLRAVPRLSAMTPAQKPVGSVSPPLSLSQAKPFFCPCIVAAPAIQPTIEAAMDRRLTETDRDARAALMVFSSNRIVGEHACAAPALFHRHEEPRPAGTAYAANGFSSAVGPYTDGTD